MKILHIHPSMKGGGIEAMICALANEMAKTEDVTVCSIFESSSEDVFWNKLSPKVKKVTLGKTATGFSFSILIKIVRIIRSGKYNVVNIHGMFYYYVLAVFLLHKKVRFFYTVHSDAKMENTSWDQKIIMLKKFCFQHGFLHPITISHTSQLSFKSLYDCESTLIFNGVVKPNIINENPIEIYRHTSQTRVFIHAGRIDTPKNQLVLCQVFHRLIKEGFDVVLLIAGAKQREDIYHSIEPYFSERIVYLGERNDIPQLMAYCDGMCLPSIWEGLPVTLLEALSVGCVPICSNVGGIPDVIESEFNGFLSASASEADYYTAMKSFFNLSSDAYRQIKRNCLNSFSKYDITNTAKAYLNAYETI